MTNPLDEKLKRLEAGTLDKFDLGEEFKELLLDAEPELVERGVAFTGQIMDGELADFHLNVARDDTYSQEARGQALVALGPALQLAWEEIGLADEWSESKLSEKTIEKIQNNLEEIAKNSDLPDLVRRRALEASVRAPDDWQEEFILEAWQSDDPDWRMTAVFGASYLREPNLAIDALSDPAAPVVLEGCKSLQRAPSDDAIEPLKELVNDTSKDNDIRITAIYALAETGEESLLRYLEELETKAREPDIKNAAAEANELWTRKRQLKQQQENFDADLPPPSLGI